MFQKVEVPVLGIVENMSTHVCSKCGHEEHIFGAGGGARMAEQYGVELLGELPLDIRIREQADGGRPTVVAEPESALARALTATWRGAPRHGCAAGAPRPQSSSFPKIIGRGHHEHQVRPLDPPHGAEQGMIEPFEPGQVRERNGEQDHLLRHLELRLRRALRERIQDLHQHQLDDRRSEELRREELRRPARRTSASFRRTPSRSPARSNTSASRATC